MGDPFQNVDAAGEEFAALFADAMDTRQAEVTMESVVSTYLSELTFSDETFTVENGCGAGAVTQRIAEAAAPGRVLGCDISKRFIATARDRVGHMDNVRFEATEGVLPVEDASVDHVVMHTLLTHVPEPAVLVADAVRALKPGGKLVICDMDFAKGTLTSFPNDPLGMMSDAFIDDYVTDPFITGKLRPMAMQAGLSVDSFSLVARPVTEGDGMLPWVVATGKDMVTRGEIGQELADALVAEYQRRRDAGTLYGFQVVATLVATKPG
ncbi:MAG: methyltransferase domain-containing protein [Boseongicola sp.]|nr:methyltransferase domain-containing protein [Boseongicola sp.]